MSMVYVPSPQKLKNGLRTLAFLLYKRTRRKRHTFATDVALSTSASLRSATPLVFFFVRE